MKVKSIRIQNIAGLTDKFVFFGSNTILMGENNSGKTRVLSILDSALNNSFKKSPYADSFTIDSKVTIVLEIAGNEEILKFLAVASGASFKLEKPAAWTFTTNSFLISSKHSNPAEILSSLIKSDLKRSAEYVALKSKAEDISNAIIATLPAGAIDGQPTDLSSISKEISMQKVELNRGLTPVELEGDGFNKWLSMELLKNVNADSIILIDEVENHLSKNNIVSFYASLTPNQIIATSHRIELTTEINTVTLINNSVTLSNVSLTMDRSIEPNVIFVEGKNDVPVISNILKEASITDKIVVVAGSTSEVMIAHRLYPDAKAIIDEDGNPTPIVGVFKTSGRQMENYINDDTINAIGGTVCAIDPNWTIANIKAAIGLTTISDSLFKKLIAKQAALFSSTGSDLFNEVTAYL